VINTGITDGSKLDIGTSAAVVFGKRQLKCRLPSIASIYTAELKALSLAYDLIANSNSDKFAIFSDSLSSLTAIQGTGDGHPYLQEILVAHTKVSKCKTVVLVWVPSHIGIDGNERADSLAKKALQGIIQDLKIPFSDLKGGIKKTVEERWQGFWDYKNFSIKMYEIQPILGRIPSLKTHRRVEVVLARTRIGHTHLTNNYLLKGEPRPECIPCQSPFTVKHILVECWDLYDIRQTFYDTISLKELFDQVCPSIILSYLKSAGVYHKF
jgi:kelch-like protein 2/3